MNDFYFTCMKTHTNPKKLKYFHTYNTIQHHTTPYNNRIMTSRAALFKKSTRKNAEFERFLCDGQEAAIIDATTSKYIPLSYFVTPATPATPATSLGSSSSGASGVGGRTPSRTSTRRTHGIADKMPFESFRLINVQQRGDHAHSLVLFKSRAITTNPEQIAIFECNGQLQQSEIRVIHTSPPPKEYTDNTDSDSDEPGTVYDVTQLYFSPISPKVCLNYGNDKYNPGYCGMFGIIAMVFFRELCPPTTPGGLRPPTTLATLDKGAGAGAGAGAGGAARPGDAKGTRWIKKWTQVLKYMRQEIPDEPECHGCMGTNLAAQVQEIIAAHPSTATAHQQAETEITRILKQVLHTMKRQAKA